MKKTYSKPEIMFENFTMSTNIAAGCDNIVTTATLNICAVDFEGDKLFSKGMGACEVQLELGYDPICYHNPTDTTNLFNS